ncbi:hypothetical protein LWF01_17470 [Saxibacter everestensis]|uniref:Uncharacterized protein n=1 Tax=Saxibacter everestensis TaxID=2909229 RepID=A0ABY8QUJ7_9MICO|nr:hypothetical protein LWF01_17470 [Brevibacteriaceae bacterium ZFBP1038]
MIEALRSGDLEAESAFGYFHSASALLGNSTGADRDLDVLQMHEGFWCLDSSDVEGSNDDELAWFQAALNSPARIPLPIGLVMHSAAAAIDRLGEWTLSGVRIQLPLNAHCDSYWRWLETADLFAVPHEEGGQGAQVTLWLARSKKQVSEAILGWLNEVSIAAFAVATGKPGGTGGQREQFDSRWELRNPGRCVTLRFDVPEWSVVAVASLVWLLAEAAHHAGANETAVIQVEKL